jgi:hypothetical protein
LSIPSKPPQIRLFALLQVWLYCDDMKESQTLQRQLPSRLLSPDRVRAMTRTTNLDYGNDFTDADWDRVTERLEALVCLLWEFSQRQVQEEQAAEINDLPAHSGAMDLDH